MGGYLMWYFEVPCSFLQVIKLFVRPYFKNMFPTNITHSYPCSRTCKRKGYSILAKMSYAPANILQCTAFLFNYFYSNILPIERMKRNETKCFHWIHFHSDAFSQTASTYRYPTTEKSQHLIPCVLPLARIRAKYLPIIEFT
jgi:hypothetical protein